MNPEIIEPALKRAARLTDEQRKEVAHTARERFARLQANALGFYHAAYPSAKRRAMTSDQAFLCGYCVALTGQTLVDAILDNEAEINPTA
jgi:hypothetical protein